MGIKHGDLLWGKHPHVRAYDQLSFGERAADVMRNSFGSWTFVGAFCLTLAGWMVLNTAVLGARGFDRFPYILLNLCLSCLAALQGALILIAQKRADRVAAEEALAHYQHTDLMDELLKQNTKLTQEIHQHTAELAQLRQALQVTPGGGIMICGHHTDRGIH